MSKRIFSLLACMLVLVMLLSACGGAAKPQESSGTPAEASGQAPATAAAPKDTAPTKISILAQFWSQEPVPKDNSVLVELEKRTNTDLDIQWVSANVFNEKVAAMIATGDLPDYSFVNNLISPQIIAMARQGAFWDITPYIKDYKNLSAFPPELWKDSKIDGKNYAVPRSNVIYGGYFFNIRTDWLDKLGLKTPQTMDDLYNVMTAFTKQDPDKNGKNDTIGMTMNKDLIYLIEEVFNEVSVPQGTNGWKLVDGKVQSVLTLPGETKALEWLQNAYKDGLIPKDFATMSKTQVSDLMAGGKAGIDIAQMNGSTSQEFNNKKLDPNAKVWPLSYIVTAEGKKIYPSQAPSFGGAFVIPKKNVKEDKLKKILAFSDYGWSPEGSVLCKWGFEGIQHTKNGGLYIKTEQGLKDNFANLDNIFQPIDLYRAAAGGTGVTKERYEALSKVIDEQKSNAIDCISANLISDTYVKFGPDIDKQANDLKIQVIMGQKTLADWEAYVAKLQADPNFQKITEEMNQSYQSNK